MTITRALATAAFLGLLSTGCASQDRSFEERVADRVVEDRADSPTKKELRANAKAYSAAARADAKKRQEGSEATSSRPDPAPAPATAPDADLAEVALPTVVREQYPGLFDGVSDEELNGVARLVCEGFDVGLSFEETVANAVSAGLPREPAGFVVGAATVGFCPEHDNKVPQ